jgi:hypothetical protein
MFLKYVSDKVNKESCSEREKPGLSFSVVHPDFSITLQPYKQKRTWTKKKPGYCVKKRPSKR